MGGEVVRKKQSEGERRWEVGESEEERRWGRRRGVKKVALCYVLAVARAGKRATAKRIAAARFPCRRYS